MNKLELIHQIRTKKSFLCIGLDSDETKIPKFLHHLEDPVFEFNRQIIDATHTHCVAYKPNTAFYESRGQEGWKSLQKTIQYLNERYPNHFTIADAKRGDIGNTSSLYAKAFFQNLNFDSITVAPYMGEDSVTPFLAYPNKWVILLALTSNSGADNFQLLQTNSLKTEHTFYQVYEKVMLQSAAWGSDNNMMYVVGATRPEMLAEIRKILPNHFFLVPGIGAQGGNIAEVVRHGMNQDVGLLINASRSIIFASSKEDFAEAAAKEASILQEEMSSFL